MTKKYPITKAFILITILFPCLANAQSDTVKKKKVSIFFSWGYNKDWFSKSNIHFKDTRNNSYDFTLFGVRASDRPEYDQVFSKDLSVPQYGYRAGIYLESYHAGLEINFDHTKYVVRQNQKVRLKGQIHEFYYNQDTAVTDTFLLFEHTNGANYLMLNFFKVKKIHETKNKVFRSNFIVKGGGGVVIPKTDVTLFGKRLDNRFHIAGYVAGIEGGLRLEMFRYFFLEPTFKVCFANYMNVLTVDGGKAKHHFWSIEAIVSGGFQFKI